MNPVLTKTSESIYYNSPYLLQNFLVSMNGAYLQYIRKGAGYKRYAETLRKRDCWTDTDYRAFQETELQKIIHHAVKNVPFYRDLYRSYGVDPDAVKGVNDLSALPIITKKDVREHTHRMLDVTKNKRKLLKLKTSGTTGTPLVIYADRKSRQMNYSFFDWFVERSGGSHRGKTATFGGRIVLNHSQNQPPFWRYSLFQRNLLFSSYHLSEKNLPAYIEKLNHYKPQMIESYPSSIYILSRYILKNNISMEKPKLVVTSAETLFSEQRAAIEEAFGCKVFDQYGAVEMCVFVFECRKGRYHIRPDYGIVEILESKSPGGPNAAGRIVCTGLINWTMPLIRYDLGDIGSFSNETCDCGIHTPILQRIEGRMDDVVYTKSGKPIGRLSPILKGFHIKEAVYLQEAAGKLTLKAVKDAEFTKKDSDLLLQAIRKRVGDDMDVSLEFVDRIRRSGQKTKAVISNVVHPPTSGG